MFESHSIYLWLVSSCIILGVSSLLKIIQRLSPDIRRRSKPNLRPPGYELFYTDQKNGPQKEGVQYSTILISTKYQLQGKPDFIFESKRGLLLPVELKSGELGDGQMPHEGDLLQLAAYFLIIEDVYAVRPKHGRLIYKDCMFVVKNSRKLRKKLLSTVDDMRDMLKTGEQEVSPGFTKCRHCICRDTVCDYHVP